MLTVGDLLFFKPKNIFEEIVCLITNGKYYHVAIYLGFNQYINITIFSSKKDLISLEGIDVYRAKETIYKRCRSANIALEIFQKIKGYDLLNFIAFLFINVLRKFKIKWFEKNNYVICSEVIADSLTKAGIKKQWDIPNSLLSPNDLIPCFNLDKVE